MCASGDLGEQPAAGVLDDLYGEIGETECRGFLAYHPGDFTLLQGWLEDLAHRRHRQCIEDLNTLRHCGPFGDVLGGEGLQCLRVAARTRIQLHIGDRYLAGMRVRTAHGCDQCHRRMRLQGFLEVMSANSSA